MNKLKNEWTIVYDSWIPENQPLREALCTLGNGNFATRGAAEETSAGGNHYPGTYLAGGYNRLKSHIAGKTIENEDLVNWPNWLLLKFRINGEDWFSLDKVEILDFKQELDMYDGILNRYIRFRDHRNRETSFYSRRIVHMGTPHIGAIQWQITPENWSGKIRIHSALDGTISNEGVERYMALNHKHLEPLETGLVDEKDIYLYVQTNQSKTRMAQAAKTDVFSKNKKLNLPKETTRKVGYIAQEMSFDCEEGETAQIEKIVTLYTSRDKAISEPCLDACKWLARTGNFEELLESHKSSWHCLWHRCDMELDAAPQAQLVLRLHIFHLLQTVSLNTIDNDVGVPARGLHGEAYRGHIFWDELFIFPFLNFRIPELTRELLMYRYRRLPEARHAAWEAGYKGAMFPWQSGSDGREENQVIHLNPMSGKWDPDNTYLQRHVNSAIVYNIWQYFQITQDREFLSFFGAELILDVALFWSSISTYNPERDRYEIHNVVGPDEYHTSYPHSDKPGLNNNTYTNVMAVWVIQCAKKSLDLIPDIRRNQLMEELGITQKELDRWDEITRKMFISLSEDGIINQFEGYEKLEEFDWEKYKKKYGNIQRLDRILKSENDSPNKYKASKQADVLMLFYLFSKEALQRIFNTLGYPFDPDMIPKNIEYYQNRSSHGSTLSRLVYSWVLSRSDREQSWNFFRVALMSDFKDIQGGTTSEGIHLGAMAGTVDIIQRCYWGLVVDEEVLWLNPTFPENFSYSKIRIYYRGHWILLTLADDKITVSFEEGWLPEVKIGFKEKVHVFSPSDTKEFQI